MTRFFSSRAMLAPRWAINGDVRFRYMVGIVFASFWLGAVCRHGKHGAVGLLSQLFEPWLSRLAQLVLIVRHFRAVTGDKDLTRVGQGKVVSFGVDMVGGRVINTKLKT